MSCPDDIICPITCEIFKNPVTACDGIIYERSAIIKWFDTHDTSPILGVKIDRTYIKNIMISNKVVAFKKLHPEYNDIHDCNDDEYKNYMSDDDPTFFKELNILKLQNILDKNKLYLKKDKLCLIHYVFRYGTPEIIKYLVDSDVDLKCKDDDGLCLIHYICRYGTPEIIKYIIDKNVDLECETKNGSRPIHLICRFSTPEMIKYIIDKNVDLECRHKDGWRPIHYICRLSTPEMIKYIVDKNVNLECKTKDGWRPIHLICRYSTPQMIKYIIDKNVDLECETKNGWLPIDYIRQCGTPEMIKYITDKDVGSNSIFIIYASMLVMFISVLTFCFRICYNAKR